MEKSGSFTGSCHSTDVGNELVARTKALVKKQETEEEDIDELVRTFKESEAAVTKDVGDAGKYKVVVLTGMGISLNFLWELRSLKNFVLYDTTPLI